MQNRPSFTVRGIFRQVMMAALCCIFLLALTLPAAAEKQIPATPAQSAMPLLPHLEWLLDSSGKLTVEDMGRPQQQSAFRPLKLQDLPREAGTVWLRFTMAGRPSEVRPATLLLDMGEGVPDTPTLFVPKHNLLTGLTEWQSFSPSQRSVFLMPETRQEPVTAYMRMDGLPGLWFSPMLRTPHNAATALERLARPAVIVALAVIMLLCLLRGLTEHGEWRIWTSLYTAAALVHVVWGVPATAQGHVDMMNVAAVLAPGLALMILPHVGRHLLRARQMSRAIDAQLFLLSLPGAALALLPLLPGYSWTTRFLDLWPLGTLLLVPTTLGAWLCGLPGARRFLLGCLLPPAGVAVGILGMGTTIPAPLLATAPLWGLALGALIIAGTAAPQEHRAAQAQSGAVTSSSQNLVDEDPNLRIVSPEELEEGGGSSHTAASGDSNSLALEEGLRGPMDDLLRNGAALAQCSLPPAPRQLAEAMVQSVHRMATTLAGGPSGSIMPAVREEVIFDLQEVLRQAHDSVSAVADSKNIALSWFMPPHLGQRYRGAVAQLGDVLCLLLESAVRATSRGAVQLAVRRVPESVNPGHLLFSVTDSGTGVPPQDRSSVALARAWELAGASRGFLGVECSPHGAIISFTLHLEPVSADISVEMKSAQELEANPYPGIIVVEDSPGERQLLSFFLEGLGATVIEARSTDEAVELYMDRPAQLLIFDGDLSPDALRTAVARVRTYEKAQGTTSALIMGLSSNDAQWEALCQAGFTHALPKPVTRSGLRSTVCQLLPQCAAQESLVSDLEMVHSLAPLAPLIMENAPESGLARGQDVAAVSTVGMPAGFDTRVGVSVAPRSLMLDEDTDDIIDTGMPLLDLDTGMQKTAPVASSLASPAALGRNEDLRLDDLASQREASSIFDEPLSMEGSQPAPLASAALHPQVPLSPPGLLEALSMDAPISARQSSGAIPDIFSSGGELATPVAGKSHADYLTSLLDSEDDLVRLGNDADVAQEAAEADLAQAVREGAVTSLDADAFVPHVSTPPNATSAPSVTEVSPADVPPADVPPAVEAADVVEISEVPPPSVSLISPISPEDVLPLAAVDTVEAAFAPEIGEAELVDLAVAEADVAEGVSVAEITPETKPEEAQPVQHESATPAPSLVVDAPKATRVLASAVAVEWGGVSVQATESAVELSVAVVTVGEAVAVGDAVAAATVGEAVAVGDAVAAVAAGEAVAVGDAVAVQDAPPPAASSSFIKTAPPRGLLGGLRDDLAEWVGEPIPVVRPAPVTPVAPDAVAPLAPAVQESTLTSPAPEAVADAGPAEIPTEASVSTLSAILPETSPETSPDTSPAIQPQTQLEPQSEIQPETEPETMPETPQAAPTAAAALAEVPQTAPAPTPAPAPAPAPAPVEASFVPLSMHADAPAAPQPVEGKVQTERARPSLLPQSTPLMDFIIAEDAVAPPEVPKPAAKPTVNASVRINLNAPNAPTVSVEAAPVASPAFTPETSAPSLSAAEAHSVEGSSAVSFASERSSAPSNSPRSTENTRADNATSFMTAEPAPLAPRAAHTSHTPAQTPKMTYGSVGEPMPITKPSTNDTKPASGGPASQEVPLARLLDYFDQAMQHARQSFEKKDTEGVHEGAAYIARQADKVGLRTVARMARCVADAGKAGDMDAIRDLLPELESTVERNRIALGG